MEVQRTCYYFVRLDIRVMNNSPILRTLVKPFLSNKTASSKFLIKKGQTLNFWARVKEP